MIPDKNPFVEMQEKRIAERVATSLMRGLPKVAPTIKTNTAEEIKASSLSNAGDIDDLLTEAVQNKASDLHLSVDSRPRNRVDGDLVEMLGHPIITDDWLSKQIQKVAPERLWQEFLDNGEADLSYRLNEENRFRVNVFKQRGNIAAVFRSIPTKIKTIEELEMPEILYDLVKLSRGLILVTGETGSGKSTTLTAMIDYINDTRQEHIVTIEDPIEFVHKNKKSLVNQREVGMDTFSFAEALKRVLRQDPDVILIGELRDPETISTALTAAETGHLVFGTLHTQSASKTIDRIIDSFPAAQQGQVRSQLSDTLKAVISQNLVKRVGGGRAAATEILVSTSAIAANIREGKTSQIYNSISTGGAHGMHTLDQDLKRLVSAGLVEKEEVMNLLVDKTALDGVVPMRNNEWNY